MEKCQLCGEVSETFNSIMFHCQVSNLLWKLTPLKTPPRQQLQSQTLCHNLFVLLVSYYAVKPIKSIFLRPKYS